jgi:hypothetical protein
VTGGVRRVRFPVVVAVVVALGVATAGVAMLLHHSRRRDPQAGAPTPGGGRTSPGEVPSSANGSPTPSAPPPIPGYLLIADRGNDRILLVDGRKHIFWQYPKPGTKPDQPFYYDDDTFFDSTHRQIISNQEEQQTIQVISFPGRKVLWSYGHVGVRGTAQGYLHTPDDAYFLPNGQISVADAHNCRILFIDRATHRVAKQYGTDGDCRHGPPGLIDYPNGDTPLPNGGMIVTEITGRWVDGLSATGKVDWSFQAPVHWPSDTQWLGDGKLLMADFSKPGHVLEMTTGGKVLWEYGPASGEGMLNHPSLAMMLPNGLIAVNDDYRDRVMLIDPTTSSIVWQYGHTDRPGTGPGFLNTPDGMDLLPFDAAMNDPVLRHLVHGGA